MDKKENKYAYFNILRFIGAICIAILLHWNDHILPEIGQQNNLLNVNVFLFYFSKNGYVFVEMFYLISGFLFAKVYIDRILKKGTINLKKFLVTRYIRIFPCVIISSIIMYFLHFIYYYKFHTFFTCGSLKVVNLLFDILFAGTATFGTKILPLNGPLWYVGPLMVCYIVAYFLTKLYGKKNNYYIYVIPIVISVVALTNNTNFFIINQNVCRGLLSFFMGVLLGNNHLIKYYDSLSKKQKIIIKLIICPFIIFFIYVIAAGKSDLFIGKEPSHILTYSLIIFPLLIIYLYDIKWINDLGKTKLFKFLGEISFSIYIWNFPIIITLSFLIKLGILKYNHVWELMLLNIIIHIIVASLSYTLIEKKLTDKIKKKLVS